MSYPVVYSKSMAVAVVAVAADAAKIVATLAVAVHCDDGHCFVHDRDHVRVRVRCLDGRAIGLFAFEASFGSPAVDSTISVR